MQRQRVHISTHVAFIAFLFVPLACYAQVYRCSSGGQQVYQQQPCAETGMTGKELKIAPTPTSTATAVPSPPPAPPSVSEARQPDITKPEQPAKSPLESLADRCLDWYRPMLRDPRGAYQRGASLEKGVLSMTIYATNGFGGYVTRRGACEFKGSRLDETWTKIQAGRLGW